MEIQFLQGGPLPLQGGTQFSLIRELEFCGAAQGGGRALGAPPHNPKQAESLRIINVLFKALFKGAF